MQTRLLASLVVLALAACGGGGGEAGTGTGQQPNHISGAANPEAAGASGAPGHGGPSSAATTPSAQVPVAPALPVPPSSCSRDGSISSPTERPPAAQPTGSGSHAPEEQQVPAPISTPADPAPPPTPGEPATPTPEPADPVINEPVDVVPVPAPDAAPVVQQPQVPACPAPLAPQEPMFIGNEQMDTICDKVYVERSITATEREALRRKVASGFARVEAFFGGLEKSNMTVVFCKTDACRIHFAGPSRRSVMIYPYTQVPGATFMAGARWTVVVNWIYDDESENVLAHESAHKAWFEGTNSAPAPAWFTEGLATLIGGAPNCSTVAPNATGIDDIRSLASVAEWAEYTMDLSRQTATYCQAAREVNTWMSDSESPRTKTHTLMANLRAGMPFATAFSQLGQ